MAKEDWKPVPNVQRGAVYRRINDWAWWVESGYVYAPSTGCPSIPVGGDFQKAELVAEFASSHHRLNGKWPTREEVDRVLRLRNSVEKAADLARSPAPAKKLSVGGIYLELACHTGPVRILSAGGQFTYEFETMEAFDTFMRRGYYPDAAQREMEALKKAHEKLLVKNREQAEALNKMEKALGDMIGKTSNAVAQVKAAENRVLRRLFG